ncbi:phage head spike fiber domain-containing protein [Parasedimentitalea huanghaiensis]|uniref:Uncharacterized protein n=1 Tax=Parasedimentitalea huanghaiensis TaxID=2682100 RepID=A0A6L6WC45_9RHOB|nr:hypothetical protein [Zongyanglinia huanghaiensis]MVO14798.1 hypothetical protein [Zongyanglinia huanghaiensis]
MIGVGVSITRPMHPIRNTSQIMADFIADRYVGGVGPGILDLFDFEAAGSRNYINALGHLVTAAPGVPRNGHHEWLNGMWTSVGLLLEPSGTNKIAQAVANITDWWVSGASFAAAADNFLGRFAGVVVTSDGETWHRARPSAEMAVVAGQTSSITAFVKEGTSGRCRIAIRHELSSTETHIRGPIGALASTTENAGTATVIRELAVPGGHLIFCTYTANVSGVVSVGVGPDSNVAGENITVYFLQFEDGHVPTSPILSDGAATSRAKDVLTLSAVTLARHLVDHDQEPELTTLPAPGLPGWDDGSSIGGSMIYNAELGGVDVVNTTGTARANCDFVAEIGKTYLVVLDHLAGPAMGAYVSEGGTDYNQGTLNPGDTGRATLWTATGVAPNVSGRQFTGGETSTFRASIKEVNMPTRQDGPEVIQDLTVHMAGLMTYERLNNFSTLTLMEIYGDSGNRLGAKVDSVNGSGDLVVIHGVDGVLTYSGDASTWAPGMGVPFDIAGSYSDTDMSVAEHGGFSISKAVSGFPYLGGAALEISPESPVVLSKLDLRFGASGIDLVRELVA